MNNLINHHLQIWAYTGQPWLCDKKKKILRSGCQNFVWTEKNFWITNPACQEWFGSSELADCISSSLLDNVNSCDLDTQKKPEPWCCSQQQNTSQHSEVMETVLYIWMIVCLSKVSCHILYLNESQFQILKKSRHRRPYYRRKLYIHITRTRMTESAKCEA